MINGGTISFTLPSCAPVPLLRKPLRERFFNLLNGYGRGYNFFVVSSNPSTRRGYPALAQDVYGSANNWEGGETTKGRRPRGDDQGERPMAWGGSRTFLYIKGIINVGQVGGFREGFAR